MPVPLTLAVQVEVPPETTDAGVHIGVTEVMVGVPFDVPPESDPPPPQAAMPAARRDARIILIVFMSAPSPFFPKGMFSCGGGERSPSAGGSDYIMTE